MLKIDNFSETSRALSLAENAGVPVVMPVYCQLSEVQNDENEALNRLIAELRSSYPLPELESKDVQLRKFQSCALIEFNFAHREPRLISSDSSVDVCKDLAEQVLAAISEHKTELSKSGFESAAIRPLANLSLSPGVQLIIVSFTPNIEPLICSACYEDGRLVFGTAVPEHIGQYIQILTQIWPFAFDAYFISDKEGSRLCDVTLSSSQQILNSKFLLNALQNKDDLDNLTSLLSNCSERHNLEITDLNHSIGFGAPQGNRWAFGPLATSLESAAAQIAFGKNPILVLDTLKPSQTSKLKSVAGLALKNNGPASHVSILARSSGLAVVPSFKIQSSNFPRDGEHVTLTEANGKLLLGQPDMRVSLADELFPYLISGARSSVSVASIVPSEDEFLDGVDIGLCRSEMQILSSPFSDEFVSYLLEITSTMKPKNLPVNVVTHFEKALENMLSNSSKKIVNYRLIDADFAEVLGSAGYNDPNSSSIRGPQWAIATGFYKWQIEMALKIVDRLSKIHPINLVLTLPSAFDVSEVAYVRNLFDVAISCRPKIQNLVRFGVMIETPRLCTQVHLLPRYADVFSFGLNDLTAASFGLDRSAWNSIETFYLMSGLLKGDPFKQIDDLSVKPMIEKAIESLRNAGGTGPIFLCGAAAEGSDIHTLVSGQRNVSLSVDPSNVSSSVIRVCREEAKLRDGISIPVSQISKFTDEMIQRVTTAIQNGYLQIAAELALEWFNTCCALQGCEGIRNWKILKKWLAAAVFGELEGKFFMSGWNAESVVSYLKTLQGTERVVRVSCFQNEISCHSRSEIVCGDWSSNKISGFVESFDRNAALHVFPQQSANQLCFRAVFTEGETVFEAGWGQAMYVFENERGQHEIITGRIDANGTYTVEEPISVSVKLVDAFDSFLSLHHEYLSGAGCHLSKIFGMKQFAVEGYFDPNDPDHLAIVDIDLPMDIAWNISG